jgi:hypothetical protein
MITMRLDMISCFWTEERLWLVQRELSPVEIQERTIHWFVYVVGLDNISALRWPYSIDAVGSPLENNIVHVVHEQND